MISAIKTEPQSAIDRLRAANRTLLLGLVIAIIIVIFSLTFETFFTGNNLRAIVYNISEDAIVSMGMMILLISGVFDLSVGSVLALTGGVVVNLMCVQGWGVTLSIMAAMAVASSIGLLNGLFIVRIKANPLIVTLAMMGICRGLTFIIVGRDVRDLPIDFLAIANSKFLELPLNVWYMLLLTVVLAVLMSKTKFFRRYYYIGGNEKAAKLSGINVARMRLLSFVLSATLAGAAGIIFTSRLAGSSSTIGLGLELRNITACIIGGASLLGGVGNIIGAVLGTLFMGLVNNLMIIAVIPVAWQRIIIGAILLAAVTLDALVRRRSLKT